MGTVPFALPLNPTKLTFDPRCTLYISHTHVVYIIFVEVNHELDRLFDPWSWSIQIRKKTIFSWFSFPFFHGFSLCNAMCWNLIDRFVAQIFLISVYLILMQNTIVLSWKTKNFYGEANHGQVNQINHGKLFSKLLVLASWLHTSPQHIKQRSNFYYS